MIKRKGRTLATGVHSMGNTYLVRVDTNSFACYLNCIGLDHPRFGAMGPGAYAHEWNESKNDIDLSVLARELAELRSRLKEEATKPEHDISIGSIAAAETYAKQGNGSKVLEYLSKAGKWAFDIANKIGVPVAIEALKIAVTKS